MPIIQRYTDIKNGGILFIGNTLGLSKSANANAPGLLGSIGAFTSLNAALQVGNFPAGTTLDYTLNGSAANLALPPGSGVLYAELIWGGLYRSSVNNISALINNPVEFRTPLGVNQISPDAQTAQTFTITNDGVTVGFYVRTANVTALVSAAMNGTYSAGRIPALIEAIDSRTSETNHAGWTLAVVYENQALTLRNLTLWCGGAVVSPSTGDTDITISDFATPDQLPITGKLYVSAQEGDAVIDGDQLLFGETLATLQPVSGPNNPSGNFFVSQINNENGTLDTTGTFGNRNANAAAGTNTSACRQGWDITAVDVSSQLTSGMTTAAIRFTTDGDLYVPNALALLIDSKGADLAVTKSADKTFAAVGEPIEYTLNVVNNGSISAETVVINDLLPNEATLVAGSVTIDGVPYQGALPVTFGPLAAGAQAVIKFSVTVNSVPAQNPIANTARADYTFFPFPDNPVQSETFSNTVVCFIVEIDVSIVKSVDKAVAAAGEELLYTSIVANGSDLPLTNVIFTDAIPAGTTFVPGSVTIDGVSYPAYDPAAGFPLPDLPVGASANVRFIVKIN